MVVSSSMAVCAAEESEAFMSEVVVQEKKSERATSTAVETVAATESNKTTPAPAVSAETSAVQQASAKVTATPTPTPTPVAGEEAATPTQTPVVGEEVATPKPVVGEMAATPTPSPVAGEAAATPTPTPGTGEEVATPTPTPGTGEEVVTPAPTPGIGEEVVTPTPTPGTGEEVTPTPEPGTGEEIAPTPTPGAAEEITPTPGADEEDKTPEDDEGSTVPTPTPDPGETTVPTPGAGETTTPSNPDEDASNDKEDDTSDKTEEDSNEGEDVIPTPTPVPGTDEDTSTEQPGDEAGDTETDTEKVNSIVKRLNKLLLGSLTVDDESTITALRAEYNALTEAEKALVANYHLLISYEARLEELKAENSSGEFGSDVLTQTGIVMPSTVLTSKPVYYTSMVSNLHAGKEFYLNSLKSNYQITFSENFASVMEAIEKEHKAKYKVTDNCDKRADGLTSSADTLLARNWQDVIAIYCYEKSKEGYTEFYLNELCKEDLARIFEELNPIVRDKDDITRVTYANRHINYYIKTYDISKEDREILKKYVENDCKLLCATVTGAKGFVRQSVGDDVSEERVNVITAAYSLVGKVGYFWGGKSNSVGENQNWGTAEFVSSPGSSSTGTLRAFGLDCSGFVSWAVINGYQDSSVASSIGDGTTAQWLNAQVISEAEAQPGDLVFQSGPEAGETNHVGILCGQTEAGDWIAIHCSSSKNGVTVGEAYGASFRYIRQPSIYPSDSQIEEYESMYGYTGAGSSNVYVSDSLTQLLSQTGIGSGTTEFQSGNMNTSGAVFTDVADVVVFGDSTVSMDVCDIVEFVAE